MPKHVNLSAQDAAEADEFVRRVREELRANRGARKLFGPALAEGREVYAA